LAKKYTGSLSLDWFNKNRSIITQTGVDVRKGDVDAPKINWINKDEALFYEIADKDGKGVIPYWVDQNDIRVKENRPFVLQKTYTAVEHNDGLNIIESVAGERQSENLLIKGDNLLALNSIRKIFSSRPDSEKVKCIYIDPPYNTGSAFTQYDDNLARSEWLSLMRDRLVVLRDLLSFEGSIWISIDDEEVHYLKTLCDEVFGRSNFVTTIIWQQRTTRENRKTFSNNHEYILVYAKNYEAFKLTRNDLSLTQEVKDRYQNPDKDPRGKWQSVSANAQGGHGTQTQFYDLVAPNGKIHVLPSGRCWVYTKERMNELIGDNRIWFGAEGNGVPRIKKFLSEIKQGLTPETLWLASKAGTNDLAKKEQKVLKKKDLFDTPKPESLISQILDIATDEGDLVLDCFGGSGTTFSVCLKKKRRFIGIEIGSHMETHILPRLIGVISGVDTIGISTELGWSGGGDFSYYHLGESIINIDADGHIDFNWNLGKEFIESSLLSAYDYVIDQKLELSRTIFSELPLIGFYEVNNITMAGVVTLSPPNSNNLLITNDEVSELISAVREYKSPQSITIFTNRGVEMAYESKPDDVEIIKVPHAIFAELER
jgi:adenine-specific DNA-methyltransferase